MATPYARDVADIASAITARDPGLTTGVKPAYVARGLLEDLAAASGLPIAMAAKASHNDLIGLYLMAKKDPAAAIRGAARIRLRMEPASQILGGLLEPEPKPEPVYYNPQPEPEPEPEPAPNVSYDEIRHMIKAEVREGALEPLQRALEAMDAGIRADFSDVARKAAEEAVKSLTPTVLTIVRPDPPTTANLGLVHRKTPLIINALQAGVNVYLHGPAGSGKTTVARKCAEAFGLQFYFAAKVESEYQLLGFTGATGITTRTQFREAYEHGGVFLFDEMDASSPSAVVALNAALANGICPFPDAIVQRHPDFHCIGAGNTKLTGATRAYAGRNQLDAASIDRFAFIEFDYDDDLERALATDSRWCTYVQSVRRAIAARGLNHLVTPRATYDGCKLLTAGFDWDTVTAMVVYKGLDKDAIAQIEAAL